MNDEMEERQQPYRPPFRGHRRYEAIKDFESRHAENQKQIVQSLNRKNLFTVTITASTNIGGNMNKQPANDRSNEQQFLIDLVFKPVEPGLRLCPEETQLLLSYLGEILKEIEVEERLIAEEEKSGGEQNETSKKQP